MLDSEIKQNLDNPEMLEKLYREDKKTFSAAFDTLYPEIANETLAKYWKARLEPDTSQEKSIIIPKQDLIVLLITCVISALLIKIPDIFSIKNTFLFNERNAGLIVLSGLSMYMILSSKFLDKKKLVISALAFIIPAVYINFLPVISKSHSIDLAYIHLPLLMWCVYGLIFIDYKLKDKSKRMEYIKYNGDLVILSTLLVITGLILSGITVELFRAINIQINHFYGQYVVICGIVAIPIVATYIIRNYPNVANRIAPIIANIFSPLVLITLIAYLITIPISGKDPYNDRNFLLIFNAMLIGVMAIIIFSVSETSKEKRQRFNEVTLLIITFVALIIDVIALSAIFYRLGSYGISPNKLAVLGSNLLIFGNLLLIMIDLFKVNFKKATIAKVENTISNFLPIYMLWFFIVVFAFPLLFGFK